ncbi:MAG: type III pantothenate kinase [Candidatus Tectomicrobia bacterium]|uniref:Type III pantothenate kinase n=1 Tax=Tectimicrobiota bacterium TaxID=2528274 RepID=A0A932G262_UNCTE|nr:type III pantothenate kinase [Candidatus Tectomicrobia bacterium]
MLLVADVGNTNSVLGVFRGEELVIDWRIATRKHQTADEYGILVRYLFSLSPIDFRDVTDVIISSVVPPLLPVMLTMFQRYFHATPLVVEPGIKTGIQILVDNPREVGADRIVNAVAAYERYGGPTIVVDFGTATTFDVISRKGDYLGGVISPGITISMEALFNEAAKLPRVELVRPKNVIGKNTVHSIQSGVLYGYAGLIDGTVQRIKKEIEAEAYVVATGGLAGLIAPISETIQEVDPYLTLKGLRLIYERNKRHEL